MSMVAKLIVASGKSAGRAIAIKRNKLLIGRAEECDVRPLSEDVSRRHCAVIVGPAEVWVEDLGSRNGTYVNGGRITERMRVADGDLIRVGALELKVSCTDPAARAGTEDDVSRWLVADERPAGTLDTTQTIPVVDPAVDADATQVSSRAEAAAARPAASTSVSAAPKSGPIAASNGKNGPTDVKSAPTHGAAKPPDSEPVGASTGGESEAAGRSSAALAVEALKAAKSTPGSLPQSQQKKKSESSRDAAADALKRFFENR